MSGNIREVVTEWQGESAFLGRNQAGGCVQLGSLNGAPGVSPMEVLLLGLAGCTGSDVVSILEKKRQTLQRFEIRVRGVRRETHPKIYTEIEVLYRLWGEALEPEAVEQAIQLSKEKYCSASAMLGAVATIHSEYEINPQEDSSLQM